MMLKIVGLINLMFVLSCSINLFGRESKLDAS